MDAAARLRPAPVERTGPGRGFDRGGAPVAKARADRLFDRDRAMAFSRALQENGARVNQRAAWFLSAAHDDATIDETLAAADRAFAAIA